MRVLIFLLFIAIAALTANRFAGIGQFSAAPTAQEVMPTLSIEDTRKVAEWAKTDAPAIAEKVKQSFEKNVTPILIESTEEVKRQASHF